MATKRVRHVSNVSISQKFERGAYVSYWFRTGTYVYMRWLECEMENNPLCSLDSYIDRYIYDDEGSYQGVVCVNTINYFIKKVDEIGMNTKDDDLANSCKGLSIALRRIIAEICYDSNSICLPAGRCREFTNSIRWLTINGVKTGYIDMSFKPYICRPNQDSTQQEAINEISD